LISVLAVMGVSFEGCAVSAHVGVTNGPTKGQFIAEADAICGAGNSALLPFKEEGRRLEQTNPATIPANIGRALNVAGVTMRKLRALREPSEDQATIKSWLSANEAGLAAQARVGTALASHERAAFEAARQELAQDKAFAFGVAHGYGFRVCGTGKATVGSGS
jgi:hypothetical protein